MGFIPVITGLLLTSITLVFSSSECDQHILYQKTEDLKIIVAKKNLGRTEEDLDDVCSQLESKILDIIQEANKCRLETDPFVAYKAIPAYFICLYVKKQKASVADEDCHEIVFHNSLTELRQLLHNRNEQALKTDEERNLLCSSLEDNLLKIMRQVKECNRDLDDFVTERAIPAYFECAYVYYQYSVKNQDVAQCKYAVLDGLIECRNIVQSSENKEVYLCSEIDEIVTCARDRSEANCKNNWKHFDSIIFIWQETLKPSCMKNGDENDKDEAENDSECQHCIRLATIPHPFLFLESRNLDEICNNTYRRSRCLTTPSTQCRKNNKFRLQMVRDDVNNFLIRVCLPGSVAKKEFLDTMQCTSQYNFRRLVESCLPEIPSDDELCRAVCLNCLSQKIEVLCGSRIRSAFDDHFSMTKQNIARECLNNSISNRDYAIQ